MTRWERFYRWLGGCGPEEVRTVPEQWELLADRTARALAWLGFLYRPSRMAFASWWVNHRWQWRFWRGRYWVVERETYEAYILYLVDLPVGHFHKLWSDESPTRYELTLPLRVSALDHADIFFSGAP